MKKKKISIGSLSTQQETARNKKLDTVFKVAFIAGLMLLVWEVLIYRKTIIDLKIPLMICLIPGIFITPFLFDKMNEIDGTRGHWILHYIAHTCTTGAFILFGFMATNFYFADKNAVDKRFTILDKGSLPGSRRSRNERLPYVEIDYHGLNKELIFKYKETKEIDSAKYVNLIVKKGLWGFDILEEYYVE